MKIVVIGGTGLIGSKLISQLSERGHEAVAASPKTGVNTVTGEGLAAVLQGAQAIVDVTNPPSFDDRAIMDFFTTSTRNLLQYGEKAGVGHLVALSVVGARRMPDSGYMRGKVAQEELIQDGGLPYTIVHATQFFEFWKSIADLATVEGRVHIAPVAFQPMAADDVAKAVAQVAEAAAMDGVLEVAGPEKGRFDELIGRGLHAVGDPREVVADPEALYFGARLSENSLVPEGDARLGVIRFDDWLAQSQEKK